MSAGGNPYGTARIKAGLAHFLLGKALSSIAMVLYFLVLVRVLVVEEFAAYSILNGLVEVLNVISGFGLMHILLRYVPELYSAHNVSALRLLLLRLFAGRLLLLAACLLIMVALSPTLVPTLGLDGMQGAFRLYALAILFRMIATVLFMTLESMLHQASAQSINTSIAIIRIVLLVAVAYFDRVDLKTVIAIEIVADIIGSLLMALVFRTLLPRNSDDPRSDETWLRTNMRRMLDFGIKGYLQGLLVMPTNGAVHRLLVGARLPSVEVAMFGFAMWVFDLMQRFLPAQLLQGVMRPIMNARFSNHGRFDELVELSNFMLKTNLIFIGATAVGFCAGSGHFIEALTGGKFNVAVLPLVLLMCVFMALMSWRHVLDQVSHTVECNEALIWSNAVLLMSVPVGYVALPVMGIFALPAVQSIGGIAANLVLLWQLKRAGFAFLHEHWAIARIVLISLASSLWAFLLSGWIHWILAMVIAIASYGAMIALNYALNRDERVLITRLWQLRRGVPDSP